MSESDRQHPAITPVAGPAAPMTLPPHGPARAPRGSILDDRGQVFPVLNLRELRSQSMGDSPSKGKAALARHLETCIKVEARRFTWERFGFGIATFLALFGAWYLAARAIPDIRQFQFPTFIFICVGNGLLVRWWIGRTISRELGATAIATGICGSCGYSLRGVPPESDSCIRCPECSAAWKKDRIVRPHWVQPTGPGEYTPPWWKRFLLLTPRLRDQLAPDDRGRFVRHLDSRLRFMSPERHAEMGPAKVRLVIGSVRKAGFARRVLVALPAAVFGVLMLLILFATLLSGERQSAWELLMSLVYLALSVGIVLLILRSDLFAGPRWTGPALKQLGLCPSCGRPLDEAPLGDDGCRVCPECGGAWKTTA